MPTPKTITAFKYRTEVIADITKHTSEFKKADETVEKYGRTVQKVGKETAKAFDGVSVGKKFGKDVGVSAIAALGESFNVATLGSIIGTAVAPGVGTAIGSAIGGGIDKALSTVTPLVMQQISGGYELNKLLEETAFEFKTFAGNEKEAKQYLSELLDISRKVGILPQILIDASEKTFDLTGNLKLTRSILKAATDQAADFGGSTEVFQNVATTLGLIAEKGELAGKELQKLYRMGIDAKKYLLEATGLGEKQLERLMAQGRIRGDVAARLIAEGLQRDKGGYAAARTGSTVAGRERQFEVLMALRGQEATQNFTRGLGDFYQKANAILDSSQAKDFVSFINNTSGKIIDLTEKGIKSGVSLGAGIATGLLDGSSLTNMLGSFTKLKDWMGGALNAAFEIHSPSQWSAREIGEPLGEGIGIGLARRFRGFMLADGADQMRQTLEELLKSPQIQALLKTIEWAEGGAPNRIVGRGGTFSDFSRHPNKVGLVTSKGPSTAAGSFQITGSTWRKIAPALGLSDFGPNSQALAALGIIASHPGGMAALQAGDLSKLIPILGKDWTSTPGSKIGGGGQRSMQSWLGHFQQFSGSGASISDSNPMPVRVVQDIKGGASMLLESLGNQNNGSQLLSTLFAWAGQQKELTLTLGAEDAAIVNVLGSQEALTTLRAQDTMATSIQMRSLVPLIAAEEYHADTSIALTKQYQQAARDELIKGLSVMDQLSGMLGQAAGMIPGQQVGKRRGFLSKLLGVAAPFLSFVPGVGPILSTIAGIASNAVGGNYGAAVSGIAGGLASGGVFRSSGGGSGGSHGSHAMGLPYVPFDNYRANLHRGERVLTARENAVLGGGGLHPAHAALLDRLAAALDRFESMPAHEIVRTGADGILKRLGSDSGYVEKMGRRLNFA